MDGWMDGWIGWMGGWVGGWMGGWMDVLKNRVNGLMTALMNKSGKFEDRKLIDELTGG